MCGTMPISLVLLTGSSVVPKSIKPVDLGCAENVENSAQPRSTGLIDFGTTELPVSSTKLIGIVLLPISTCVVTGLVRASTILIKAVVLADVRHMCGPRSTGLIDFGTTELPVSSTKLIGIVPHICLTSARTAEFSTFSDVLAA
jgi:hypothetical protein